MPAFAEHHFGRIVGLLDERVHVAMPGHSLSVGILRERTEAQAKALVFAMREFLPAEKDHLVFEQGVADFLGMRVSQLSDIDPAYFRSQGGGQRLRLDASVSGSLVVELARRMKPHMCPPKCAQAF